MRFIRPRRSPHTPSVHPRTHRLAIIRWIYLSCVLAFAIWVANFFFGSLFYLRSDGLVLGEPAVVAAEFPATVRDFLVREGDHVTAGQVAALVSSQNVAESIARLAADVAARQTRLSALRIRGQVVDAMLSLAENRRSVATNTRQEYETLLSRGFLSLDKHVAALDGEYRSQQDLETLKAEKRVVQAETATLGSVLAEAKAAVRGLRQVYDQGQLRAPISGIVTRLVAGKGAVVRAGDPLIELHGDHHYVLAYVPTGGIYQLAPGEEVEITTGLRTVRGIIKRVEPYAAALPREFQRAFTPVDRQQVIRIEFSPGDVQPPLFTKVQLHSRLFAPGWMSRFWRFVGIPAAG